MRFIFAFVAAMITTGALAAPVSDDDVKQAIMMQARSAYHGDCMCPYNSDNAHHLCGSHSAYRLAHGSVPICYDRDVTPAMMAKYRALHGG
jgi:hypothetical protein